MPRVCAMPDRGATKLCGWEKEHPPLSSDKRRVSVGQWRSLEEKAEK
jgi:hypothetical protein